jgi:hypothetical protein
MNAISDPSGLKRGRPSTPCGLASGDATPPSRGTSHRSSPYTKTMCVALTSGKRSIAPCGVMPSCAAFVGLMALTGAAAARPAAGLVPEAQAGGGREDERNERGERAAADRHRGSVAERDRTRKARPPRAAAPHTSRTVAAS